LVAFNSIILQVRPKHHHSKRTTKEEPLEVADLHIKIRPNFSRILANFLYIY